MKITKSQLKQLIQEELQNIRAERKIRAHRNILLEVNVLRQKDIMKWIKALCKHVPQETLKGYITEILYSENYKATLKKVVNDISKAANWPAGWGPMLYNLMVVGSVANPAVARCKELEGTLGAVKEMAAAIGIKLPEVCPKYVSLEWFNAWAVGVRSVPGIGQYLAAGLNVVLSNLDPWLSQAYAMCPKGQ